IVGLILSRPVYVPEGSVMGLGMPLIFYMFAWPLHALGWHQVFPLHLLLLHPIALAAWVGMLATALNLLPVGQLDGGHIVYALSPRAHRLMILAGALGLLVAAYYLWSGWLIWAVAFLLTRKHPPVKTSEPVLPQSRRILAWIALLLLVLTIMPVPFDSGSI